MEQKSSSVDIHWGYLKTIALSFFLILAIWGISDILLVAFKKAPSLTVNEVEYVKDLGLTLRRGLQMTSYYVNTDGFRGKELAPIAPKEVRILVLGDSVTFGTNVQQGEEWPAMLEKYLRQHGVSVTILNAANPGRNTDYMARALKYYNERMKIDMVLVQNTGNMLALNSEYFTLNEVKRASRQLFPNYRMGDFTAKKECYGEPAAAKQNIDAINIPIILKNLSVHSLALNKVTSYLNSFSNDYKEPIHVPKGCYLVEKNLPFEKEMLSMAQLLQYATANQLPILFIKPSYAFNWSSSINDVFKAIDIPLLYQKDYKKVYETLDGINELFDFFQTYSHAIFLDPINVIKKGSMSASKNKSENLKKLYFDYAHYSAEGSKAIAESIGESLITQKIIIPIVKTEWVNPYDSLIKPFDLRYHNISASFSSKEIILSGAILLLAIIIIGKGLLFLFSQEATYSLSSPIIGYFVLLAGGIVSTSLFISYFSFFKYLTITVLIIIFYFTLKRKFIFTRSIKYLILTYIIFSFFSLLTVISLHYSSNIGGQQHVQNIKTYIAWAEYLTLPDSKKPFAKDLYHNQDADGVMRPYLLANILRSYPEVIYPNSTNISTYLSNISGMSIQNVFFGSCAAFATALFMWALMLFLSFRQRNYLFVWSTILISSVVAVWTTIHFPTSITMTVIAAALLIYMTLLQDVISNNWIKFCIIFTVGSMFYILPIHWFVAVIFSFVTLAVLQAYTKYKNITASAAAGLFMLICLLSSRAFIFNMTVLDTHLYALLDNLSLNHFFL